MLQDTSAIFHNGDLVISLKNNLVIRLKKHNTLDINRLEQLKLIFCCGCTKLGIEVIESIYKAQKTEVEQQDEESSYDDYDVRHDDDPGRDRDRDYFGAMTDEQLGDYGDFIERGSDMDYVETWARG
ncbi:MAG TPA: hypothetical protein VN958_16220 [Chitinophagaceae bacterium]|nr:hypothetical protein [Chitinophagaceae bacterium]